MAILMPESGMLIFLLCGRIKNISTMKIRNQSLIYGIFLAGLMLIFQGQVIGQTDKISLDGQWEIIFDENNQGREADWMRSNVFEAQAERQTVQVPGAWETIKKDYEGVAFYRKVFDLPANWAGKIIRLQFGAVNYLSEVWINDEVVGYHEGGFTPFEFRVDEMIRPGEENVLTLRIVGPIILSDKEIDGVKKLKTPQWRGGITGGIGNIYIDEVFLEPEISNNTVTFHVEVDHTAIQGIDAEVEMEVYEVGQDEEHIAGTSENCKLHPGINKIESELHLPDVDYWSPDNPQLYRAVIRVVADGQVSDSWQNNFGMRELTIKDRDFYLNGKRIYIKATFFEGLYPNGIAYPDSEEMARKEIRLAKEAGFNMIRPWRRPPTPMWLDLADEMGVLVVGSPALECMRLPLSTPYLPSRVKNEITQAVLRDRNRACVVQWELFNELHRPVLKQLMRPMAMITRQLDPTRLILDESGGWAYGANMYLPNDFEPTKFNDIHTYPGPFINERTFDGFLSIGMTDEEKTAAGLSGKTPGRNVVPGLMSFVSELGYGSLPELVSNNQIFEAHGNPLSPAYRYHKRLAMEQEAMIKDSGFGSMYPDMRQFYLDQQIIHGAANKRMIEAVRSNPEVDGYCIHALVGGDWILGAGLLDLWRNPKSYAYEGTKAANQPRIVSIRAKPRNVYAAKGTTIELTGINELQPVMTSFSLRVMSKAGDVVFSKEQAVTWGSGVSTIMSEKVDTKNWEGDYTVEVIVYDKGDNQITMNSTGLNVFAKEDPVALQSQVAIIDRKGSIASFLKSHGVKVVRFTKRTDINTPVLVTQADMEGNGEDVAKDIAGIYESIFEFANNGGTILFIDGLDKTMASDTSKFPIKVDLHPARGLWTCIPHLVKEHPVFNGLPSNTMMRDVYENVWPTMTLRNLKGKDVTAVENIVASIGFDWFSVNHKMHYSGPGTSWWGSDLPILSIGKGRCIISQLRLKNNLGKDPVADKILLNLIDFASGDEPK
jgi:hypothetical protein